VGASRSSGSSGRGGSTGKERTGKENWVGNCSEGKEKEKEKTLMCN
jgi:hypothetical protein